MIELATRASRGKRYLLGLTRARSAPAPTAARARFAPPSRTQDAARRPRQGKRAAAIDRTRSYRVPPPRDPPARGQLRPPRVRAPRPLPSAFERALGDGRARAGVEGQPLRGSLRHRARGGGMRMIPRAIVPRSRAPLPVARVLELTRARAAPAPTAVCRARPDRAAAQHLRCREASASRTSTRRERSTPLASRPSST